MPGCFESVLSNAFGTSWFRASGQCTDRSPQNHPCSENEGIPGNSSSTDWSCCNSHCDDLRSSLSTDLWRSPAPRSAGGASEAQPPIQYQCTGWTKTGLPELFLEQWHHHHQQQLRHNDQSLMMKQNPKNHHLSLSWNIAFSSFFQLFHEICAVKFRPVLKPKTIQRKHSSQAET